MYRFGICASKYHRAAYTKIENLQTCLGNFAVEPAKANSGLSEFSQKAMEIRGGALQSMASNWNVWESMRTHVKT